jgi:hypothetical protein
MTALPRLNHADPLSDRFVSAVGFRFIAARRPAPRRFWVEYLVSGKIIDPPSSNPVKEALRAISAVVLGVDDALDAQLEASGKRGSPAVHTWHAAVNRWPPRPIQSSIGGAVTSDRELVRRAQQGDAGAFSALVRQHQDAVYRLAVRMVGRDMAEDVAQAAFLKAWQED